MTDDVCPDGNDFLRLQNVGGGVSCFCYTDLKKFAVTGEMEKFLAEYAIKSGMPRNLAGALRIFVTYAVLSVACFLMLRTILGYTSFRDDAQFLAVKQAYVHNVAWKTAFYVHVFSAIVALLAGFTQFSRQLWRDHPKVHRLIGKIYVANVLMINFPAGLVMGVCANGGLGGKTAFLLLDTLWFYFTLKAFLCAKNKRFAEHKNYMTRSYALTFSAITLRTWNMILSNSFELHAEQQYVIDAWLGFVPNLMIAEIIIRWNIHPLIAPKGRSQDQEHTKSENRKAYEENA